MPYKLIVPALCVVLIAHSAAGFFWGWGSSATRRGVKYYICLNTENATTSCFYCTPQQSTACTGLQGPPQQVTEVQAACLLQYCPATGRRRRSLISSEILLGNRDDPELGTDAHISN
ncbi:uncharacterized protein LOC111259770 [Varroa jacobsoni]|uniref:Secreted protein n=1 Tax=Varroa destructor TaxID=109461 RepID=A0A7M7JR18_VARDE|nr:uncharacterized protein LOC111247797 [Varroa destructor]XP_022687720.1 uncharacterized protein LOC111259770 [Varroa jacobsoni]